MAEGGHHLKIKMTNNKAQMPNKAQNPEAMTNDKAQNPNKKRMFLAFKHLDFNCHLNFDIWNLRIRDD
jgi:hypothetical protein